MAHWGDEDQPFDQEAGRDDDLRWFMFVMLLAVLTLTVVFLAVL